MKSSPAKYGIQSIQNRIILGFLSICMLLLLSGIIGYIGSVRLNTLVERFHILNHEANLSLEISITTAEMQSHVVRFMHEGYTSAGNSGLLEMDRLRKKIESLRKVVQSFASFPEEILPRIQNHLDSYESTFREVIEEKRIYNEQVRSRLPQLIAEIKNGFHEFHNEPDVHQDGKENIIKLQESWFQLVSYFESFEAKHAIIAIQTIENLEDHFKLVHKNSDIDTETSKQKQDILNKLAQYKIEANRTIQAIRGYLYLINVVMSGEAAEIKYQAQLLKEKGDVLKQALMDNHLALVGWLQQLIILVTGGTVLAGILFGVLFGRQLSRPIREITSTFQELSKGNQNATIPDYHRNDEIGDLVKAADVFRQKNEQTESLLENAESLTRKLEDNQKKLERVNAELEEFVYTVSHDLKSPIVTSSGFIGIIRELAEEGKYEEAFSKIERLERANQRMSQLVNDLLDLSRVGRQEGNPRWIDSKAALLRLKENFSLQLEKTGFELRLQDEYPPVYVDEGHFQQIFENLMSNAIKYGKKSEEPKGLIEISALLNGGMVEFSFCDHGEGIPEDFHEKIFKLFSRMDTRQEGSGIGLAIVRKFIEFYGGKVWVESPRFAGAVFHLQFPRQPVNE